ncbi:MAG: DegT/DnrJ/EryC1/StrS aminotransferase [Actinomycetia bacterium]|nr:DegT/DnrJ/EryC1/StrS aminotransferase [Actinomycetes bacterium]
MPLDSLVPVGAVLRDVLEALERSPCKLALLVDGDGRLQATMSDGDVRRAMLVGAGLLDPALPAAAPRPWTLPDGSSRTQALRLMREQSIAQVPILAADGTIVDVWLRRDLGIPLAEPFLSDNTMEYLAECVASNFVSSVGPFVDRFEREFAAAVGARHAVACTSGTAALHVALRLMGAAPGTEVAVPTFTFIASVNAVAYTGATPLLVDSERATWNMDGERLVAEVEARARRGDALPAVIEAVHILGQPADLEPLVHLRDRYGIPIVEDAAESLGATYLEGPFTGRAVGTIGDLGCFSFNGNKIITTGGGGMIVTDDDDLARRARHLTTQAKVPGRGYVHDEVGYNYRLSNLLAALGVAQLEQLPTFLTAKRAMARRYDEAFADLAVDRSPVTGWADATYWLYSVLAPVAGGADALLDRLDAVGVQARPLWTPLHHQAPFAAAPRLGGAVAEDIHGRGVSLPSSVNLTAEDQDWVVEMVHDALAATAR